MSHITFTLPCYIHPPMLHSPCHVTCCIPAVMLHVVFTLPCYMLHSPSQVAFNLPCYIHSPMLQVTFTLPCYIHPPLLHSASHVTFTLPIYILPLTLHSVSHATFILPRYIHPPMLHSPSHITCYIHPAVLHSPMAWSCRPPGAGEGAAQRDVRLHHRGPVGASLSRAGRAGGQLRRHVGGDGGWRLLHCHHHLHLRPASAHPAGCKSCRAAALPVCALLCLSISLSVSHSGVHGLAPF